MCYIYQFSYSDASPSRTLDLLLTALIESCLRFESVDSFSIAFGMVISE